MHDLIPLVAILTIFIGTPSMVFYWILRMKREARGAENSAMGMQELEERIQRAVQMANEPLRLQIGALEDRLMKLDQRGSELPAAGEPGVGLLAARQPQPH